MSLGLNVQNFAVAFKVDPKVLEWLQKGGILGCEGIASLAAKKEFRDAPRELSGSDTRVLRDAPCRLSGTLTIKQ